MLTAKLQEIRKRVGLSQSQLAAQMGVDTSLISRWEKGEREPSFSQQMDLARLLGVSVDYLVNGKLEVDFLLRAKVSKADEKKPILQALTDAEQQINYRGRSPDGGEAAEAVPAER
jgi:transcriptional regulator with XRE-family HTH domain